MLMAFERLLSSEFILCLSVRLLLFRWSQMDFSRTVLNWVKWSSLLWTFELLIRKKELSNTNRWFGLIKCIQTISWIQTLPILANSENEKSLMSFFWSKWSLSVHRIPHARYLPDTAQILIKFWRSSSLLPGVQNSFSNIIHRTLRNSNQRILYTSQFAWRAGDASNFQNALDQDHSRMLIVRWGRQIILQNVLAEIL